MSARNNNMRFQMPGVQTMVSRKSSITNAFVMSIIPVVNPSDEDILEALRILEIDPEDVRCAYCGDPSSEWDHLRPLVLKRRPTGFISEIANLVPSCGKCNQSKGNKDWKVWIRSSARHSPATRGVADLEARVTRLLAFETWRQPAPLDFEKMVGPELWKTYWETCEQMVEHLKSAQGVADTLKGRILQAHNAQIAKAASAAPASTLPAPGDTRAEA
ncbi:MAG: HNH endonuclease [Phycisphaerae bacterium]|nr:HNH endonuclease [Phycisphaerae bacterium]